VGFCALQADRSLLVLPMKTSESAGEEAVNMMLAGADNT